MRYSYSSLNTLSECEKKFSYRYQESLYRPQTAGPPLVIGSFFDSFLTLSATLRGQAKKSLLMRPTSLNVVDNFSLAYDWDNAVMRRRGDGPAQKYAISVQGLLQGTTDWWGEQTEDFRNEFMEKCGGSLPDRMRDLWLRYQERWGAKTKTERPLLVQAYWNKVVPGSAVELSGYCDEVFLDTESGLVTVRDHKLMGYWPQTSDTTAVLMDSQLHMQAWGLATLLGDDNEPRAVEYNRVRYKRPSVPAVVNGRGKDATKRRSQAACDTDAFTYRRFLESEPAKEAGITVEQDYLDKLLGETDSYFRRVNKPVNLHTVREHLRAAVHKVERIVAGITPENAMRMPSKSCDWCDFRTICEAGLIGELPTPVVYEDYGLARRSR